MNILFVNPPKSQGAVLFKLHEAINEEVGVYPVLGLLYVATYVKKNSGHNVLVIDCPAEGIDFEELRQRIRKFKPDIVGIYVSTEYMLDALKTARVVKDVDKKIIVVAGGPHVYVYPKETIDYPDIDYCVYGEGEVVFYDFVDSISSGSKSPDAIFGVVSKRNKGQSHTLIKIDDINTFPFPDRRLTNYKLYKSFITYNNPVATMITSRGCAYNCYYCNSIERAQKVRMMTAENVIKEIEDIVSLGIKDILIFDENFTFDINRVREICEELLSKKINIRWHCRSRADMKLDITLLKKMRDAGCRMIQFGIETGSQRLQKIINKNLDLEKAKHIIKMTKKAGILTYGNFMFGLPTETKEELRQTINFSLQLDLDYVSLSLFNPLPDSVFYLRALKEGIIENDYWREFAEGKSDHIVRYTWPLHDQDELTKINQIAFRKFYLNPKCIIKALFRKQSLSQKLWQIKSGLKVLLSR